MSELTKSEGGGDRTDGRCHACGCVGPNPGTSILTDEEIIEEMKSLRPVWALSEDKKKMSRKFTCRNWQAAMNAIQEISAHAESKDIQHHPDLHLTNYRDLEIVLWTHAAGGLTKNDFVLAMAIDKVKMDYSPKWLKQNPLVSESELQLNTL
ncbi:4a-hydroxytetrahydrobiopterin dehydratase [archaeon]|nr:MAG: 4a-hydroxytetrahydrobiopterin dehydratase [archaeon]